MSQKQFLKNWKRITKGILLEKSLEREDTEIKNKNEIKKTYIEFVNRNILKKVDDNNEA